MELSYNEDEKKYDMAIQYVKMGKVNKAISEEGMNENIEDLDKYEGLLNNDEVINEMMMAYKD